MLNARNSNSIPQVDNWEQHWKKYSKSAEKNPAQAYRRKLILKEIQNLTSQNKWNIVDIGSGQGDMLVNIDNSCPGHSLFGIELSQEGVDISSKKLPNAQFYQHNLVSRIENRKLIEIADICLCTEVLEHLENPLLFLQNTKVLLKKNGKIIITVPGGPRSFFDIYIGHRRHYSRKSLTELLTQAGFRVDKCECAGFPFFNIYKLIVILRGKRLINDADSTGKNNLSTKVAFTVMSIFNFLFKFNLRNSNLGWQILATAQLEKKTEI